MILDVRSTSFFQIEEAFKFCCAGLLDPSDSTEMIPAEEPMKPVHLSRMELNKKTKMEQDEMIHGFVHEKFSWLFADQSSLKKEICKGMGQ